MMASKGNQIDGLDMNESMILEEEIDENYEPTEEEIIEYALYLGMDPKEDADLLYIAKEGLKAPLPENWKPCKTRDGDIYYFNFATSESQWEHPCDEYYKKLYQEMKSKKMSKGKGGSKFKSNLPPGKNAPKNDNKLKLESKDSANTSFSENKESSFNAGQSQTGWMKSSGSKFNLVSNKMMSSSGFEQEYEKIDQEYEDKLIEYQKDKQRDFDKVKKARNEETNDVEGTCKREVQDHLDKLREELSSDMRSSKMAFMKEKEKLRAEYREEYDMKAEEEIKKVEAEYKKLRVDKENQLRKNLDDELVIEEEKIRNDFENKKKNLLQKKKEVEIEAQQNKREEDGRRSRINDKLENEKKRIAEDYAKLLRDLEAEELTKQAEEIANYKRELDHKLEEEQRMLAIAQKQKDALSVNKRSSMKESFDKKFEKEKEMVDAQIMRNLKDYEEAEKMRKENEISKQQEQELKLEKEKRRLKARTELDDLKLTLDKRFENYKQILLEKYDTEKNVLNQQIELEIEKYKKEVQNIKTDLSSKEDIVRQINQIQQSDNEIKDEIESLQNKLNRQREQNDSLRQKVSDSQKNAGRRDSGDDHVQLQIEQMTRKTKELDDEITKVSRSYASKEPSRTAEKMTKTTHSQSMVQNKSMQRILRDIHDIKHSLVGISNRPAHEKAMVSQTHGFHDVNPLDELDQEDLSELDLLEPNSYQDWVQIYSKEKEKIEDMKDELKNDKLVLRRTQEYLAVDQERFKQEYLTFKMRDNQSPQKKSLLKKLRRTLNQQVKKLNEDVYKIRELEFNLKNKERALKHLAHSIQKFHGKRINRDEMRIIYQNYKDLDFRYKSPLIKEEHTLNTLENKLLSDRESKEFYERWKGILENQLSLEIEESEPEYDREEFISRLPVEKPKIVKTNNYVEPSGGNGYSYENLIRMMDLQLKAKAKAPDNPVIQRHISQSLEQRYKVKMVFNEHAQWLKNIKGQLNRQLYERPGKTEGFLLKFQVY